MWDILTAHKDTGCRNGKSEQCVKTRRKKKLTQDRQAVVPDYREEKEKPRFRVQLLQGMQHHFITIVLLGIPNLVDPTPRRNPRPPFPEKASRSSTNHVSGNLKPYRKKQGSRTPIPLRNPKPKKPQTDTLQTPPSPSISMLPA